MKRFFLFPMVLIMSLQADAQLYLFGNTASGSYGNSFGTGYKIGKISPYLGLSLNSYFNQYYDTKVDTLHSDDDWDIEFSPTIGMYYYFLQKQADLFLDINIGTYFGINFPLYYWPIKPSVGIGIEKVIDNISISGELSLNFMYDFAMAYYKTYHEEISFRPKIEFKYFFPNRKQKSKS
jgi:hypothetical protein